MPHGKFISIEGTEGAGKSTALHYVKVLLEQAYKDVIMTREPGGTPLAEEIRRTLLHPEAKEPMCWETELLLMFAARAQHIQALIKPALAAGKWVVSDRFVDASFAYQGGGRGIPMDRITMLSDWIVGKTQPDLTILLDIDPAIGLKRADARGNGRDRIEQEKIEFFERVRQVYLQRAAADPKRIKVVQAGESLEAVQAELRNIIEKMEIS
jgi:dTMP kinase